MAACAGCSRVAFHAAFEVEAQGRAQGRGLQACSGGQRAAGWHVTVTCDTQDTEETPVITLPWTDRDEHRVHHVHKAHAQLMRCPDTRQSSSLEHAPEAARHVQIIAIRHAVCLNHANVHPLCSSPTHPVRSICAGSSASRSAYCVVWRSRFA